MKLTKAQVSVLEALENAFEGECPNAAYMHTESDGTIYVSKGRNVVNDFKHPLLMVKEATLAVLQDLGFIEYEAHPKYGSFAWSVTLVDAPHSANPPYDYDVSHLYPEQEY